MSSRYNCPVCRNTLKEPVTFPCGHHSCEHCFMRSAANPARICPECRVKLPPDFRISVNTNLQAEIEKSKIGDFDEIKMEDCTVIKTLGQGAFGKVLLCKWKGQDVAVKQLLVNQFSQETIDMFIQELAMLNKVKHPNCMKFMGASVKPPRIIVTEILPNKSLWDYLRSLGGAAPPREKALGYAVDVAAGMEYLHSIHMLHRDLKSMNVLLDKDFNAKLADFGLSRIKADSVAMTTGIGTPQWMSPELLAQKPYNEKADVYAFGMTCWELYTGQPPFRGMKQMEVGLFVVRGGRPPFPPGTNDADPFVQLIKRCWDQNPDKRPTMAEAHKHLQDIVTQSQPKPSLPISSTPTPSSPTLTAQNASKGGSSSSDIPDKYREVCARMECGMSYDVRAPGGCLKHDKGFLKFLPGYRPDFCMNPLCAKPRSSKPGCIPDDHKPSDHKSHN
mmetsp:Transcript_8085/g.13859  ORF Transcript_8085/g.13859 Transcript_8085/m.13859 type:complete len:446 (+) Transcript_8085:75-1412(+)